MEGLDDMRREQKRQRQVRGVLAGAFGAPSRSELNKNRDVIEEKEEDYDGGPKRRLVCAGIALFVVFLVVSMTLAIAVHSLFLLLLLGGVALGVLFIYLGVRSEKRRNAVVGQQE